MNIWINFSDASQVSREKNCPDIECAGLAAWLLSSNSTLEPREVGDQVISDRKVSVH